jgi:hypothetical protein
LEDQTVNAPTLIAALWAIASKSDCETGNFLLSTPKNIRGFYRPQARLIKWTV